MTKDLVGTALIFDLDGTLVDTAEDLAASMNHALGDMGFDAVAPNEVRHLVGHGARRMLMRGFEISANRDASESELDEALERFLKYYQENIADHSRPFEYVIEMIEGFRARGAVCAICTNKREGMAVQLMTTLNLDHLFETIVGADTTVAAKPDPAPVSLCLKRTGAKKAVFIGDSDTDIKAAMATGLPCAIADFGYGPLELAGEATAVFANYREAASVIENLLLA
ncbi:HAD-IA family hydrolase [Hyphococcus lacteus]|uniref:phosphoglycolate phosphatase n=1 Tax=Hyphococcus lacteus TaxID=3143536 RepID=A0ABV3Z0F0_9PROT